MSKMLASSIGCHQIHAYSCLLLLALLHHPRPVPNSRAFMHTGNATTAEGSAVASQPPANPGQPHCARVAWDLYQYVVSAGFELIRPAVEGLWASQVCEGFKEDLAELADSETFAEFMSITAIQEGSTAHGRFEHASGNPGAALYVQAEAEWATEMVNRLPPPSQQLQLLLVLGGRCSGTG
ncbi:TPA: hypothetical protein ACH3X1_015666 [Trebouxia sp. C0004]